MLDGLLCCYLRTSQVAIGMATATSTADSAAIAPLKNLQRPEARACNAQRRSQAARNPAPLGHGGWEPTNGASLSAKAVELWHVCFNIATCLWGHTQSNAVDRAHPDLNQGPADLQSAARTTELCTQVMTTQGLAHSCLPTQRAAKVGWPTPWRRHRLTF